MHQQTPELKLAADMAWCAAFYRTPLSMIEATHNRLAEQFGAEQYKALERAERAALRALEEQPGGPHAEGAAPALRRARYVAIRCHADYLVRKNPWLVDDDSVLWAEVERGANLLAA